MTCACVTTLRCALATEATDDVLGLFVLDPVLWGSSGRARRAWLAASLRSLDESMDGRLVLHLGDPATVVPAQAAAVGASSVFVTGESTPYGVTRDARLRTSLEAGGTPYAIDPGTVLTGSGMPYKVFTPFFRSWLAAPRADPQPPPRVSWAVGESDGRVLAMMDKALREGPELPMAGEDAAARRWKAFVDRVRMITASFLTKDLHVWWPVGARHFLDHPVDGDLASNNHGWQWVAGTGTDASPYFRIFNPVSHGQRFDPGGDYVRRWVPELAHLPGKAAHEPWKHDDGYAEGYPARIVDHDEERLEALRRYASRNSSSTS